MQDYETIDSVNERRGLHANKAVDTNKLISADWADPSSSLQKITSTRLSVVSPSRANGKSIGDSGFGQAQPGAIVAFDGTNCNFFSPKDSYTLYQDGDTYKLDVTSYLFADTLTFTVNTIDEDHIVITSGQTVTELERVE